MLIGFLLPLLRRLSARGRMLIATAAMAAGLALVLALALHGHANRESALPIRLGLLLTLAGLGMFVGGARAGRRDRQRRAGVTDPRDGADHADDQR